MSLATSIAGKWATFATGIYVSRKGPEPLGTVVFEEIEAKAIEKLKELPGNFMYAGGSAGTCTTYRANRRALDMYAIIPRMLVDATTRNLEVTLFGTKYNSPLLIAPIGVQGIFHGEAELAPARAAGKLEVPFIMSTASCRSIEEVAEANGNGPRWYQLYWPKTNDVALSLLKRAKDNGFKVLVVTLDTMLLGWRPHDMVYSFLPFAHGVGTQVGTSDPVFMARYGKEPVHERPDFPYHSPNLDQKFAEGDEKVRQDVHMGIEWLREANSGIFRTWEDLRFIRDNWDGPMVLKGIQSVHDAEKAMDYGADGIVVSNHGGRQVDGAIPSLYALVNIMKSKKIKEAQAAGKFTVLFDSGIRNGSDIIKAMAIGAQGVLLGRPWLYGMVCAGEAGVDQVIRHTLADLDTTLGLAGYQNISEIHGKADEILQKLDFAPNP